MAEYSLTGELIYLADLQTGRYAHACSKFLDDDGRTVRYCLDENDQIHLNFFMLQILLVTGGRMNATGNPYLSSTEIYSDSTWTYAAPLPSARAYLPAATFGNSLMVFGKIVNLL